MKFRLIFSLLFVFIASAIAQNTQDDKGLKEVKKLAFQKKILETRKQKAKELNLAFSNLEAEKRKKYLNYRKKASQYLSKKRLFEALNLAYKAQEIFDRDPTIYNIIGAVNVEIRDFGNAKKAFDKALLYGGENFIVRFNLAELQFCSNNWKTCLKEYLYIIHSFGASIDRPELKELMDFKVFLCYIALANQDGISSEKAAEYNKLAKKWQAKYTYNDDCPFYYYSRAAEYYMDDDHYAATGIVAKARRIFGSALTTAWNDTMIEFGFVTSHYGTPFNERPAPDSGTLIE